jgi:hypothetical protein
MQLTKQMWTQMAVFMALAAAGDATFKIRTELPSSAASPSQHEYVAVMADDASLPAGTKFLKLVIVG